MLNRLIVLVFCFLVAVPAVSRSAESTCFTCHSKDDFRGRVVHRPLETGSCTGCHNPHVARYKGLLNQQGAGLCYTCHTGMGRGIEAGKVHPPVLKGQCLVCHEPHVSSRKNLLRAELETSCFECHGGLKSRYQVSHQPYSRGECFSCHRPHQSEHDQLLKAEPNKVCFSCHRLVELRKGHQGYPASLGNCLTCHDPHGSKRAGLLRNMLHEPFRQGCRSCHEQRGQTPDTDSCLKCHAEVGSGRFTIHNHITGKKTNTCVSCHSPHAADTSDLLRSSQDKVCRRCHQDTVSRYRDSLYKHPEIDKCTDCHEVHGSNELAMLKGNGNQACTGCHESQGTFTHPVGSDIRDPRSGQMVSCTTCHNPMGSDFKYQLTYSGAQDLCRQCHKSY